MLQCSSPGAAEWITLGSVSKTITHCCAANVNVMVLPDSVSRMQDFAEQSGRTGAVTSLTGLLGRAGRHSLPISMLEG